MTTSRRSFLTAVPAACLAIPDRGIRHAAAATGSPRAAVPPGRTPPEAVPSTFPSQDPTLVREMVGVSHGNASRVRELLERQPALANAAWDWGFGDWETALGAASHVGNGEIARLLLASGARPSIFSAAMLNQLDAVRAFVNAHPGVQRTRGPHGIPLLSHALAGGATEVADYLKSTGGADVPYTNEPLEAADRAAIAGTYQFGPAPADRLVAAVNRRGDPVVSRQGGVERTLLHLGSRVFHPAGAEAVRIRFAAGANAPSVTVDDGPLVVTAQRVQGS